MEIGNIFDIEGTRFPAGRKTRVMIGQNGTIKGEKFCQGYVEIYPGGKVPQHSHETVESYTILEGEGIMTVDGESQEVKKGNYIFIPSGKSHELVNTGEDNMIMMFVYAPGIVVDHWEQEKKGELR